MTTHEDLECRSPWNGKRQVASIVTYAASDLSSARGPVIELRAGCSFAELDRPSAVRVMEGLRRAIAEYDRLASESAEITAAAIAAAEGK